MTAPNEEKRTQTGTADQIEGPGPYLAKVKSHLDGEYMGRLKVELLKNNSEGNSTETTGQTVTVSYLSPFYGVTPYKGLSENEGGEYSQSSYGFWAVPPDIDTTVLVIFAEGNRGQGYWIGCVHDQYMNFMTPGRASTGYNDEAQGELRPVTEYNKRTEDGAGNNPTQFIKPCDKDACAMLERSGLMSDPIRGHTSSSARREVPSMVFGLSTPGPADWRDGSPRVSYGENFGETQVPFNRLGGSTFVMDDGDPSMYRTSAPSEGPSAYASLTNGGNPLYPANELVRIRTRTGHQILMHNSEDLVLIQHGNGTMIELTAGGKIDIYAKDSVNVHATTDINLKADRNINIEAGSAINMKSGSNIVSSAAGNIELKAGADGKITAGGSVNLNAPDTRTNKLGVTGTLDVSSTVRAGELTTSGNLTAAKVISVTTEQGGPGTGGSPTAPSSAASAPSPTRVPQGGGWTGSENLNPAAHTPEATDNTEGTSSPAVNEDGTTAEGTPEDAGQANPPDTFEQCTMEPPQTDEESDTDSEDNGTDPNATQNPDTAQVVNPDETDDARAARTNAPQTGAAPASLPPENYDPTNDPFFAPIGDDTVVGSKIESDNTFVPATPTVTKDSSKARVTQSKDEYQYSDAYLRRQARRAAQSGGAG